MQDAADNVFASPDALSWSTSRCEENLAPACRWVFVECSISAPIMRDPCYLQFVQLRVLARLQKKDREAIKFVDRRSDRRREDPICRVSLLVA